MFILYDLIFLCFTLLCLPVYLFKGKFHAGFLRRLGVLPRNLQLQQPVWIHAVSVGETVSIRGLVKELRRIYPKKKFVISTVTPTGNKIALTLSAPGDLVTYLPLDFSFIVDRVIKRIDPALFIIAETEIWPNLVSCLAKSGIPIVTVNARISDNSFRGYSGIRPLIKPILNKITLFCAQTDTDAERLKALGVAEQKIRVTGNMKFDQLALAGAAGYRERLGLNADEKLWIAGSTHAGEEETVLRIYKDLLDKTPDLRLLIAPRHPQRADDLLKAAQHLGFNALAVSRLKPGSFYGLSNPVFILDTIGELAHFYAAADVVFVGGSLVKKGGHNILEPAALGKPVIFGAHMFNFRDITEMFLNNKAAIMVKDARGLEAAVLGLLQDPDRAAQLIAHAREVIARNQGATRKNIEEIAGIKLSDGDQG